MTSITIKQVEMELTLQEKMFDELRSGEVLDRAGHYTRDYLSSALERHVFPTEEALEALEQFDEEMPGGTSNALDVIDQLGMVGGPSTVTTIGGRYFGFVTGSVLPVAMAAKSLATTWDQNSGLQVLSPLCAKLEQVVEHWMKSLFGLPDQTVAGFVSGTSTANFCALAAARFRILKREGWDQNSKGLFGAPKVRIVTGRHAHSSAKKAISLLGFGIDNIEYVDVDGEGRLIPESLPALDARTILVLQAGNVDSGAFDPFDRIGAKVEGSGAWVHIDGAFGLWAAAVPAFQHLTRGHAFADSWAVDAHKTLNTPYDSGIVLCKDREAISSALHMEGSYIILQKRDGMFFTPEMSRRSRVIELWAALKYLGRQGLAEMVMELHHRAVQFADQISAIQGFEVVNDVVFNQVLVRCENDALTDLVISRIQSLRDCWVGGSMWFGRRVIRVSICGWTTTRRDIEIAVRSFQRALHEVN